MGKNNYTENSFRERIFSFLYLFLLILVFQVYEVHAQNTFGNVAFGGGGFITGIVSHKTSGDVYCRTDVGGAYRWDASNSKWIPLLDWNSEDELTYQGVEALALDPQNANNLYLFCGTDYFNGGKTAILKSTDKGNTFSVVEVTSKFKTHGNGLGRGNGERLAVDPNNGNVLFCGTKANGLWKSTDGGSTWTQAWNGVTTTSNGNGINFVVFDPSSASGGVTQTIYFGVSRTGAGNIYKSTNGGSTFTAIQPDNSFMPHRAVLSPNNSALYVTMADGEGPNSGNNGRVYKLTTATGAWTNITPNGNNFPYGGVSVDPSNANRIIVSTENVWGNNQFGNPNIWADFIFLSTDGGSTWTSKITSTSTLNTNGIGWIAGSGIHWTGSIDFDPKNSAKVRVTSGNGLFTCDDINASATSWKFDVKGMEETVVLDAISIPGGKFISAVGDQYGAAYSDVYAYPTQVHTPTVTSNNGITFAANNINKIVRATDKLYYSADQGSTWTVAANTPGGGYGKIALSADGNTTLYCASGGSTTYYSTNNGGSWTSTGVTNAQDAHPIADYVNTNKFYIYNRNSGQLLVSTNKGVSFTASSSNPGAGGSNHARAVPGYEGHVWVALSDGLKYTTNNGTSWTTVANVSYCGAVGIGKAATGAAYPAVYIWGTVSGVRGMFRSTNQGASWTRINDDAHEWGGPGNGNFVIGDMNVYGRAYMSTVGRGLVIVESGGSSCTPSTITPYTQVNGGDWQQTASASLNAGGNVMFGPQPASGGSWSWSGPNGFSANTREVTLSNIQSNQAGNYVATYTNAGGCQSTQTFTITVNSPCTPTAIVPYLQINGGTWQQTASASLAQGGSLMFGPQPATGGSWSWSGPNNFSANTREVYFSNIQANQAGNYVATYTNANGCNSAQTFNVTVTGSIVVRARGTQGDETIELRVDGSTVATWTLISSFANYTASGSGAVTVHFTNDNSGRDVQIDNVIIGGVTYQSENQQVNTGVWTGICGGSNSEWLNCNGYISYTNSTAKIASVKSETSIEEKNNTDKVIIYPNPSRNGVFQLNIPWEYNQINIVIFDINGKQVYQEAVTGKQQTLINSKLGKGFYFVRIQSDKATITQKLIVE